MYSRLKAQRKAGGHASAIWDLTLPSKHLWYQYLDLLCRQCRQSCGCNRQAHRLRVSRCAN